MTEDSSGQSTGVFQNIESNPQIRMLPAFYLAYLKIQAGVLPEIGKMFGYAYTLHDNSFEASWEIVEED